MSETKIETIPYGDRAILVGDRCVYICDRILFKSDYATVEALMADVAAIYEEYRRKSNDEPERSHSGLSV